MVNPYEGSSLGHICLPAFAGRVLAALEDAHLQAWVVGGWVRDALLGHAGHDVDICCSGTWEQNAQALRSAGIDVVESGIKFGGITALVNGSRVEVTSFRLDGFYTDGRHPQSIEMARSIEEDLARRDFTINAMAWHPARGLLDRYEGQKDLIHKQIRAVGVAQRRFEEDALRMLRAARFACRLDFTVEPITAQAIQACAGLISAVAQERIGTEINGILATRHGGDALARYPELMCAAVPELSKMRGFDQRSPYHAYDVYEHTVRVLTVAGELSRFCIDGGDPHHPVSPSLMWAALLHDVGKPATFSVDASGRGHFYGHPEVGEGIARSIMRRLSMSSRVISDACLLIRLHDQPVAPTYQGVLGMMRSLSANGADAVRLTGELLDLKRADALGKAPLCFSYVEEIERMREIAREALANKEAYSLATLALHGKDLIAAGVNPGPRIGELLQTALDAVIQGSVTNDTQSLLKWLGYSD